MTQAHYDYMLLKLNSEPDNQEITLDAWDIPRDSVLAIPAEYEFVFDHEYDGVSDIPDSVAALGVTQYSPTGIAVVGCDLSKFWFWLRKEA